MEHLVIREAWFKHKPEDCDSYYPYRAVVFGDDSQAIAQLIEQWPDAVEIELLDLPEDVQAPIRKFVEIYQAFNEGKLPTTNHNDSHHLELTARIFNGFGEERESTLSGLWLDIIPHLTLRLEGNKLEARFSGSHYSPHHGWTSIGGERVKLIGMSASKTSEQIVKDIQRRIFEKQADAVSNTLAELERLKNEDNKSKEWKDYLNTHISGSRDGDRVFYARGAVVRVNQSYISLERKKDYFSTSCPKKVIEVLALIEKQDKELASLLGEEA